MKLRLLIKNDPLGGYSAVFPEIPGCASQGETVEEAIENAKEALVLWFEPEDTVEIKKGSQLVELSV